MMPPRGFERAAAQRELRKSRGPFSFLIKLINKKEAELIELRRFAAQREAEIQEAEAAFARRYPAFVAARNSQVAAQMEMLRDLNLFPFSGSP